MVNQLHSRAPPPAPNGFTPLERMVNQLRIPPRHEVVGGPFCRPSIRQRLFPCGEPGQQSLDHLGPALAEVVVLAGVADDV